MITTESIIQLKAFARQDGALLSLFWLASFACFVGQFGDPTLGLLYELLAVGSLFFLGWRLKRFRDGALGGLISFRRAYGYCAFCFFYASLIFALAQYVYFAYLDHGTVYQGIIQLLSTTEASVMMSAYGYSQQEVNEALSAFQSLRPIEISAFFFLSNLYIGAIISLVIALIMKRKHPKAVSKQYKKNTT